MKNLMPNSATTYDIPSFAIFNDGQYPLSYPAHPDPPPPKAAVTNVGRTKSQQLSQTDLDIANREVWLYNNQRMPITIDFGDITARIDRMAISRP
jgi:hypothetical protein